jgi:vitamin B12 transporter
VVEKGGFTVTDLTMSKKIVDTEKYGDITLRGEIRNLLDKEYSYVKGYPMPGRTFQLGIRYDF